MSRVPIPAPVLEDMKHRNIDIDLSRSILDAYNRGEFDHVRPVAASELPDVDGSTVLDFTASPTMRVAARVARDRLAPLLPESLVSRTDELATRRDGDDLIFDGTALRRLGLLLFPCVSYGVLNGGSATSYADTTKNTAFSAELYALLEETFERLAGASRGRAKGLTPAFVQPDGSFGPSFLELKMRNLLVLAIESRRLLEELAPDVSATTPPPLVPFFQMTSAHTDAELAEHYVTYRTSDMLADLIDLTGLDPTDAWGATQPLISAYTHSEAGKPKRIFADAWGQEHRTLPLPGGHGQSFAVLADTYRRLAAEGKHFVYLTNVDNLGAVPDPTEVAYLALSGTQAGFDFTYKTPVDVKGGVLVRDREGRLNCADIGPAVGKEDIADAQAAGKPILFNAATGLFSLDYLVPNLDRIANDLPTRFSDQDKDAGRYSQAEQVTWEVMGMLDDFLVFCVSKWDRFLAAKLLSETLMTSGIRLDDPRYPTSDDPSTDVLSTARKLHDGLIRKLPDAYAMRREGGRWVPVPAGELEARPR